MTHLCEVLAHAAHQPAMTKFPALPKWLELREETKSAMEEAAAEFVQGGADADDALIVNRDANDVDGRRDRKRTSPSSPGRTPRLRLNPSRATETTTTGARTPTPPPPPPRTSPTTTSTRRVRQEEADALKLTEEAIERQEKERLHSYERDVTDKRATSEELHDIERRPTNSAYRAADTSIDAVPDDAMDVISRRFAVPKTVESSYDVDEAAARRERRAMAPGPAAAHVPFSDVAVPEEDRAGHHEPGSHAVSRGYHAKGHAQGPASSYHLEEDSAASLAKKEAQGPAASYHAQGPAASPAMAPARHHWPPVPTGTFSRTPAVVEPEADDVEPEPAADVSEDDVEHKSTATREPRGDRRLVRARLRGPRV